MAITKEMRKETIQKFQRANLDTGSSEVQIALLTQRINDLTLHFKKNKKDNHSRRGLMNLVHRRRKLLSYLRDNDLPKYQSVVKDLGIRK